MLLCLDIEGGEPEMHDPLLQQAIETREATAKPGGKGARIKWGRCRRQGSSSCRMAEGGGGA